MLHEGLLWGDALQWLRSQIFVSIRPILELCWQKQNKQTPKTCCKPSKLQRHKNVVLLDVVARCDWVPATNVCESTKREPDKPIVSAFLKYLACSATIMVWWQLTIRLVAVVIAPLWQGSEGWEGSLGRRWVFRSCCALLGKEMSYADPRRARAEGGRYRVLQWRAVLLCSAREETRGGER